MRTDLVTPFVTAAAAITVVVLVAAVQLQEVKARTAGSLSADPAALVADPACFGAAAMANQGGCDVATAGTMVSTPEAAAVDKSDAYADNCWSNEPFTERPVCTYGVGDTKVALVGNSHAGHWLPPLQILAQELDWQITTFLVSRCNPTFARLEFDSPRKTDNCYDYGQWVLDQTTEQEFDLVITSERQSLPVLGASWEETPELATQGYRQFLQRWVDSEVPVLVIRDTPTPGRTLESIPDCLAASPDDWSPCSGTVESWEWMDPLYAAAESMDSRYVRTVDLTDMFCTESICPPVIGSVVVYFDASHVTATYGRSLAPYLGQRLEAVGVSERITMQ